MPQMLGVEALRMVREKHPRAMRILLTGYSDLTAILGSVNESEVFRFVNKPWDNDELRGLVAQAAQIAREAPPLKAEPISERDKEEIRKQAGILVIEDDPETQNRLREILGPHYQVRFATTTDRALQVLEQHETGVVISETDGNHGDLTALIKTLKQYHPHIASVVLTDRANAQIAIDLINEGQVFRMLLKPVRMGSCRLSVEAALGRYWELKNNPRIARRFSVAARKTSQVSTSLLQRIKSLPQRLFAFGRVG
jgi:DNA-binding NtrC family response regulator